MTGVIVRPAQVGDLDAIARVFLACWHTSYADLLPPDVRDLYTTENASELWRRAPLERMLVAEAPHRGVLGVTRFGPDPDEPTAGHVFSLYVDPDSQGFGLGRELLTEAAGRLRAEGFAQATLWVFADNEQARAFYARQGWVPDGGTRVEAAFGLPELRYRLRGSVRYEHVVEFSSKPNIAVGENSAASVGRLLAEELPGSQSTSDLLPQGGAGGEGRPPGFR
jgi:ribosomal protein S18 acetylase RimI-like enzyme